MKKLIILSLIVLLIAHPFKLQAQNDDIRALAFPALLIGGTVLVFSILETQLQKRNVEKLKQEKIALETTVAEKKKAIKTLLSKSLRQVALDTLKTQKLQEKDEKIRSLESELTVAQRAVTAQKARGDKFFQFLTGLQTYVPFFCVDETVITLQHRNVFTNMGFNPTLDSIDGCKVYTSQVMPERRKTILSDALQRTKERDALSLEINSISDEISLALEEKQ
ncbi:MAG: hypothetical protein AB7F19_04075 [Candidatus Babeliales bacterium]